MTKTTPNRESFWIPVRALDVSTRRKCDPKVRVLVMPPYVRSLFRQSRTRFSQKTLDAIRNIPIRVKQRVNERWASLMGSLTITNPVAALKVKRCDLRCILRLYTWVVRSVSHSGIDWLDTRLKAVYEYSRYCAGAPKACSAPPEIPSGVPGRRRDGHFEGLPLFRWTSWWSLCGVVPSAPNWSLESHSCFSSGKRAMGFPTMEKKIAAIRKFCSRVQTPVNIPESVLDEAEGFMYHKVTRTLERSDLLRHMHPHVSYSSSSCLEKSFAAGGRIAWCAEQLQTFSSEVVWFIQNQDLYGPSGKLLIRRDDPLIFAGENKARYDLMGNEINNCYSLSGSTARVVLGDHKILLELSIWAVHLDPSVPFSVHPHTHWIHAYDEAGFPFAGERPYYSVEPDIPLTTRIDTVDDDGAKARVIGISSAPLIHLGHLVRTVLTAVMKADATIPTMSSKGKKISKLLRPRGVFDSKDLTAATDTTSFELARRLAMGAVKGLRKLNVIPAWLDENILVLVDLFLRPQTVLEPSWAQGRFPGIFPFVTKRSIPMGMPHSWPCLNFDQQFQLERAIRICHLDTRSIDRTFCGDDSATSGGTEELSLVVRDCLREVGYSLSVGTDIISDSVVQYTEQIWVVVKGSWREISPPMVKSLCPKEPPTRLPQLRHRSMMTTGSSRGPASSTTMSFASLPLSEPSWVEKVKRASALFVINSNWELIRHARSLGLPVYFPKEFGGMGFSHPAGNSLAHVPTLFLRGAAIILKDDRSIGFIKSIRTLGSFWTLPVEPSAAEAQAFALATSWIDSVFEENRKATSLVDLEESCSPDQWAPMSYVDVEQIGDVLGVPCPLGDWEAYDSVKKRLREITGFPWFPISEAIDHVERSFAEGLMFLEKQKPELPQLGYVAKRVFKYYRKITSEDPHQYDFKRLRKEDATILMERYRWHKNRFLVYGGIELLRTLKSKFQD